MLVLEAFSTRLPKEGKELERLDTSEVIRLNKQAFSVRMTNASVKHLKMHLTCIDTLLKKLSIQSAGIAESYRDNGLSVIII